MEETMQSAKAIAKCYEHSQIHQREEEVTGMKYQMSPDLDGMKMVRLWDNEDLESRQVESMAELKEELSKDTVMSIAKARSEGTIMQTCELKGKKEKWGPMLVERQRRAQDNGVPILQRAMELKKKKYGIYAR
jgi:hypothetical protein